MSRSRNICPTASPCAAKGEIQPLITEDHQAAFRYGMKCFFEEGRALARLSHPNVIRVLNFFRANETVYMVMEYEHGRTLQEFIQTHRGEVSERFIRGVFTRLLNGLREVHSHKLLHLDLKPSNIYLRNDNTPVLIDFGAARQTLSTDQPMLKPMYTPGFASPEHYGSAQGPRAVERHLQRRGVDVRLHRRLRAAGGQRTLEKDTLVPAMMRWEGEYSDRLLEIIDWCLNLNHFYRPQSVFALQKALVETITPPVPKETPSWLDRVVDKYKKAGR